MLSLSKSKAYKKHTDQTEKLIGDLKLYFDNKHSNFQDITLCIFFNKTKREFENHVQHELAVSLLYQLSIQNYIDLIHRTKVDQVEKN